MSRDWKLVELTILALGALQEGCASAIQPFQAQLQPSVSRSQGLCRFSVGVQFTGVFTNHPRRGFLPHWTNSILFPLSTKISMSSETCTKFTTFLAHNPQYQIQKTFAQCVTVVKSLLEEEKKNLCPHRWIGRKRVLRLLSSSVSSYAHHSWQTTFGSSSVSDASHSCARK